jgi:hypothetical protein
LDGFCNNRKALMASISCIGAEMPLDNQIPFVDFEYLYKSLCIGVTFSFNHSDCSLP